MSKVTISDIASQAGVTKATVSMVFRNKPGISVQTRDRVLDIARELNYTPFQSFNTRGPVYRGQVGFVVLTEEPACVGNLMGGSYLSGMINGCIYFAENRGTSVALSLMTWEQARLGQLPTAIQRQHVDGFLFRGWVLPEVSKLFEKLSIPIVMIDCDRRVDGFPQVYIDNIYAMDLIVDHLMAKGCRHFATITGDMDHINAQERLAGLQISLIRRGLSLDTQNIIFESRFNEESGRRGAKMLLERHTEVDALICQNDLIALGAMNYLQENGRKIPDDIHITGFDDMEFSSKLAIPLTTIDSHSFDIGRLGAQLLNHTFEISNRHDLQIRSPVSLIARKST
jgi:DNA-binding LacI/PurR family transcriptional regulator